LGEDSVVLGMNSSCVSGGSIAIGSNVVNDDVGTSSCVIGNGLSTIRSSADITTDLGTAIHRYREAHVEHVLTSSINGRSPIGGVFSKVSTTDLSGIAAERDMVGMFKDVDYVGSLTLPANTMQLGDTYSLKASGLLTCSNGDGIFIRLHSNFNGDQRMLFECPISLKEITAGYWEIECEIVVRANSVLSAGNFGQFPIDDNKSFTGDGFNTESLLVRTDDNDLTLRYTGNLDLFTCTQAVLTKIF